MSERQTAFNPYAGPRALIYGEAMFGREREVSALRDLLTEQRIVLFFATRGAGRTSLINAGLIPRLQAEGFRVLPVIRALQCHRARWTRSLIASRTNRSCGLVIVATGRDAHADH